MGISIKEFEEMTPYQLNLIITNYADRENEKFESMILETYLTAAWTSRWVWSKKIPKYEKIMSEIIKEEKQNNEQMLEQVKKLNAMFGGKVKIREEVQDG